MKFGEMNKIIAEKKKYEESENLDIFRSINLILDQLMIDTITEENN